jgi:cytoskeletal protein CcmA (bactofilin family)
MSFWNKIEKPFSDAPASPGEPHPAATAAAPWPPAPAPAAVEPPVPAPAPVASAPAPASPAPAPGPVSAAANVGGPGDLRLGRGVRLEGKLTFSGTVRIDATFQGSIITDGVLVVGEGAKVEAEIACGTVIVEGEVIGDVVASQSVELHASGRLRGDVEAPAFAIDRGGVFEGASRRPGGGASSDRRAGKHAASPAHEK